MYGFVYLLLVLSVILIFAKEAIERKTEEIIKDAEWEQENKD